MARTRAKNDVDLDAKPQVVSDAQLNEGTIEPVTEGDIEVINENDVQIPNAMKNPAASTEDLSLKREEAAEAANAAKVSKAVVQTAPTLVNIHTISEVDCWIGGVHYYFAKDKNGKVPVDVAQILTTAKKAYRN